MLLLNFSHPFTADHLAQVAELTGQAVNRVIDAEAQFDVDAPFAPQVADLTDNIGLSPAEWQTLPILVNPPALNVIAATLLADLHGRMGHFPPIVRLRPASDPLFSPYEIAEIINLQAVRACARTARSTRKDRQP